MPDNRPRSRQKNVTSGGSGVRRRGSGMGTGRVGSGSGSSGGGVSRAAVGGGGSLLVVVIIVLMQLFGGNSGGGSSGGTGSSFGSSGSGSYPSGFGQSFSSGYTASASGKVNTEVAAGSRAKRTEIIGNNKDTVTLMVYMCGTDLESKYGMATNDIQEMAAAKFGSNVNVIIYTGGCSGWKLSRVSSKVNQIYQIKDGKLKVLVKDDGAKPMTDPNTLSSFIQYCNKNFPANRSDLILWDHGGGSVSGYGYDEKYKSSGSMNLTNIGKALQNGGVKFDFVGFDACLMATAETALMLNNYADYMIASEETEPGIGWYYTNWLTALGSNTSMSTLEIGKNIIDDFITACGKQCPSSATTLSIIDLAEFSNTVPSDLSEFSRSVSTLITNEEYKTISDARYAAREFAKSSKIDQVDLVNLAENIGTAEGKELAQSLKNAVKYNRTSPNITDAYGVSIYFPYQRTSYVDTACVTYNQIGMDEEYGKCIRQFAKLETSGQIAAGGTSSPVSSLFGGLSGGSSGSADIIGQLLGAFISGSGDRSISGLDGNNTDFMTDGDVSDADAAEYLSVNFLDPNNLIWSQEGGKYTMELSEDQWELVHMLDLNMFYDDGEGYVDLGYDNVFSFEDGKLVADTDRNWVSINGQPVAYYHTDTTETGNDYTISGYVPVLLNGERASLILKFDSAAPNGYIAGASTEYVNSETKTIPKELTELTNGDTIDFLCDFYSYDGEYRDSYKLGSQITVSDNMVVSNTDVGSGAVRLMYRFTDIYNQQYWSEAIIN